MFEKTAISLSQTVDKTENANNNEIKILVLPHASLKSQKMCFQTILCINTLENAKFWQVFVIFIGAKMS